MQAIGRAGIDVAIHAGTNLCLRCAFAGRASRAAGAFSRTWRRPPYRRPEVCLPRYVCSHGWTMDFIREVSVNAVPVPAPKLGRHNSSHPSSAVLLARESLLRPRWPLGETAGARQAPLRIGLRRLRCDQQVRLATAPESSGWRHNRPPIAHGVSVHRLGQLEPA